MKAIKQAKHSVLLCTFDPTDNALFDAAFAASDAGRMMLALVNRVPTVEPSDDPSRADVAAKIEIFDRAAKSDEIVGFNAFSVSDTPTGFEPERVLWPGIMVRVHHKFVVIDAERDQPIVFTGSANLSGNSLHHNDENLLEITKCPRLAGMYMAEFLRLYEHYRARIKSADPKTFKLSPDARWGRKYYTVGAPECKARIAMAGTE